MDSLSPNSPERNPERYCTGPCGRLLPATYEFFGYGKTGKYGLKSECKSCYNERAKAYRRRPETKDHSRIYQREYFRRPGPKARNLAQTKARYQNNPISHEKLLANVRNRDIRKKAVNGTHTARQIQDLLKRQKHTCYYCSAKFEKRKGNYIYHIDHTFPLSRVVGTDIPANDISYLVLACPTCNLSKGNKYPWEFYEGGRLL